MAEKSLDDRIKEAELARQEAETAKLRAEHEKLKEETALVHKQVNAKWYAGKKLAAMATGVLTVVALYGVFDGIFLAPARKQNQTVEQARERLANINARLLDARIDSLHRKQAIISATIDSLTARAKISAAFEDLNSLEYANILKHYKMITANNYYDRRLNPDGGGVENDFEVRVVKGDTVIDNAVTQLTWQGGSEFAKMNWENAKAHVDALTYAGFDDWRVPTLQEAMSLMKAEKVEYDATEHDSLYIDAHFKDTPFIWTSEKYTTSLAWSVDFFDGYCKFFVSDGFLFNPHVRAVR